MLASVHLADVGTTGMARVLLRRPKADAVAGLRWANVALLAPLAFSGRPPLGRVGLIAFWDDEDAIDGFLASDRLGQRLSGGFHARLRPLRAYGSWPGLSTDIPDTRAVPHDGPVVAITFGRLRISQTKRFMKHSRPAEKAASAHDGFLWGTAAVRPPFVATITIWRNSQATAGYAYKQQQAHSDAMAEQQRKDFHKQSAFIRFAPTRLEGKLQGKNPLSASDIDVSAH
jgi:hypothetical protein